MKSTLLFLLLFLRKTVNQDSKKFFSRILLGLAKIILEYRTILAEIIISICKKQLKISAIMIRIE